MENEEKIWKKFLRNHWRMVAIFVIAAVLAVTGAIYIFLSFVKDAQATGLVPSTLNLWTMGYLITFLLHLIFWELLLIVIPVLVFLAAVYFLWWKKIPEDEREEYRRRRMRSRMRRRGGAISFFINIAFIIKVYVDGNWDVPFANWKFDYLVYSYFWAFVWVVAIFGIPAAIVGILWLRREMKKTP